MVPSTANSVMTLRARGLVVLRSSAAEVRIPDTPLLPFFWRRALKSSFLLEARVLPVGGQSLPRGPLEGAWEFCRLPKASVGSFQPSNFRLDLQRQQTPESDLG